MYSLACMTPQIEDRGVNTCQARREGTQRGKDEEKGKKAGVMILLNL